MIPKGRSSLSANRPQANCESFWDISFVDLWQSSVSQWASLGIVYSAQAYAVKRVYPFEGLVEVSKGLDSAYVNIRFLLEARSFRASLQVTYPAAGFLFRPSLGWDPAAGLNW
jgi:hypothetical protein